jgi:hypothetical protein
MTQAYLYRWTEKTTGMWYIGSRYAKDCHPNDGYICSSKTVKPMIMSNPDQWSKQILVIGTPTDIRALEANYLLSLSAAPDCKSYNKHNGNKNFHTCGIARSEKQIKQMLESNPSHREDVKEKLRIAGKSRDVSHLQKEEYKTKAALGRKKAWAEGKYQGVGFKEGDANIAKQDAVQVKLSETRKQRKIEPMTNKKHSEETKQKMAAVRALYWANKRSEDAGKNYTV